MKHGILWNFRNEESLSDAVGYSRSNFMQMAQLRGKRHSSLLKGTLKKLESILKKLTLQLQDIPLYVQFLQ